MQRITVITITPVVTFKHSYDSAHAYGYIRSLKLRFMTVIEDAFMSIIHQLHFFHYINLFIDCYQLYSIVTTTDDVIYLDFC